MEINLAKWGKEIAAGSAVNVMLSEAVSKDLASEEEKKDKKSAAGDALKVSAIGCSPARESREG